MQNPVDATLFREMQTWRVSSPMLGHKYFDALLGSTELLQ